ncbi:hypothetical protein OE810_09335 [Rhodobacteraceae bacterium XHP0102]|nr:hypothetical protein [Rhodobacteraceae bacterium XHP0102]
MRFAGLAREERFGLALTDSGRIVIKGGEVFEMADLRDTSLILGLSG